MTLYLNLPTADRNANVYRIIEPKRLYQMFESRCNVLVHPSKWDDPYENRILKSRVRGVNGIVRQYTYHERMYGQCWTLQNFSDAMWRIYSPTHNGVRIKTTIQKLMRSLYHSNAYNPRRFCVIGKVRYLGEKRSLEFANSIYRHGKVTKDDLFKTLLVKRNAFRHEKEIRLLYFDSRGTEDGSLFAYQFDPHELIDQIMVDPRASREVYKRLRANILRRTGFVGPIRHSMLYRAPEETILTDAAV